MKKRAIYDILATSYLIFIISVVLVNIIGPISGAINLSTLAFGSIEHILVVLNFIIFITLHIIFATLMISISNKYGDKQQGWIIFYFPVLSLYYYFYDLRKFIK